MIPVRVEKERRGQLPTDRSRSGGLRGIEDKSLSREPRGPVQEYQLGYGAVEGMRRPSRDKETWVELLAIDFQLFVLGTAIKCCAADAQCQGLLRLCALSTDHRSQVHLL